MENKNFTLNSIPEEEKTPLVKWLLEIVDSLHKSNLEKDAKIENLTEEINKLKKLKGKPQIKPSTLNDDTKKNSSGNKKRPGSNKRSKKNVFFPDTEIILKPDTIPVGSIYKGYRTFDVQELVIETKKIRYKIYEYQTPDGQIICGKLPENHKTHFGSVLKSFIVYQHHQCRVPQNIIYEQLIELGFDMSEGQVNRILTENLDDFHNEKEEILIAAMEVSSFIHTDDTGARHKGKNGFCNVIGNELFTYFSTTNNKTRLNFLEILCHNNISYIFNEDAKEYLLAHKFKPEEIEKIDFSDSNIHNSKEEIDKYILSLNFKSKNTNRLIQEAGLLAHDLKNGLPKSLTILSDGAPQFAILNHALCWVHIERPLRKLSGFSPERMKEIENCQTELWNYYRKLKDWQQGKNNEAVEKIRDEFDTIFNKTYDENSVLNEVLRNIYLQKEKLLMVLKDKKIPLHTNAAENDIREFVTRRKISGGTRSDFGKKSRDTFASIKKTCKKLNQSFWNYLNSRFSNNENVKNLGEVIRLKAVTQN